MKGTLQAVAGIALFIGMLVGMWMFKWWIISAIIIVALVCGVSAFTYKRVKGYYPEWFVRMQGEQCQVCGVPLMEKGVCAGCRMELRGE